MRVAGTMIWATDLAESSESTAAARASPASTTYSYSAQFRRGAVEPADPEIGRIWADGNLLRGAAGDLKVGRHAAAP